MTGLSEQSAIVAWLSPRLGAKTHLLSKAERPYVSDRSGRVAEWHGDFLTYCGKTDSDTYPWPAGGDGEGRMTPEEIRQEQENGFLCVPCGRAFFKGAS